jgi:hypothetical protein
MLAGSRWTRWHACSSSPSDPERCPGLLAQFAVALQVSVAAAAAYTAQLRPISCVQAQLLLPPSKHLPRWHVSLWKRALACGNSPAMSKP